MMAQELVLVPKEKYESLLLSERSVDLDNSTKDNASKDVTKTNIKDNENNSDLSVDKADEAESEMTGEGT